RCLVGDSCATGGPTQQALLGSSDSVNEWVYAPTDTHGIEGSDAQGGGSTRSQYVEQGERRPQRPQRLLPSEPRPAGSDGAKQVCIHPFAQMGAQVPRVIVPPLPGLVIPFQHRQELSLAVPIALLGCPRIVTR